MAIPKYSVRLSDTLTKVGPGAARPCCAWCDRPARKRVTYLDFSMGSRPKTKEEAQRRTNQQIISVKKFGDEIYSANVWDGETYIHPFCTNACAMAFGYAAYASGSRRVKK